jgi:hypothetical protein
MKRIFFPFRLPANVATLTALSFRNKGHMLLVILSKISLAIYGQTKPTVIGGTWTMIQRMLKIRASQGLKGLTLYLKTCSVCSQQALGSHILPSTTPLNARVSRTSKGVPRILPILWRTNIFNSPYLARYVLSIFAIYRFFLYESPVKVKAITAPYSGSHEELERLAALVPDFMIALTRKGWLYLPIQLERYPKLFPILTKSPTTFMYKGSEIWSSNIISVVRTWIILHQDRFLSIKNDLEYLAKYFGVPFNLKGLSHLPIEINQKWYSMILPIFHSVWPENLSDKPLGKLGLKQEAAGKMRVFAMVDPITQWVLHPLHKYIFNNILSNIPMDGTFNQLKPLQESKNWKSLYSLDLSSATDRLPLSIQKEIINYLFPDIADAWANVLVGRQYYNPEDKSLLSYAVGQPMGAYSSWAMLALTHHFIVMVAAWDSKVVPVGTAFTEYAILGDDIVIGNSRVARSYLNVITALGVECGLHKSLLSPKGLALEFAKRTWYRGVDVSPITVKDLASALTAVPNLVQFGFHHNVSLANCLKIAGYGYKVLGGLNKPFYKLNQLVRNIILSHLIPANFDTIGELFGRTSLTQWKWEPSFGDPILLLFREWAKDDMNKLYNFVHDSPLAFMKDQEASYLEYVQPHQDEALADIVNTYHSEFEILFSPSQRSSVDPLVSFQTYLKYANEVALVKGMTNVEPAKARFGVDPKYVSQWKVWQKAVTSLSSAMSHASKTQLQQQDNMRFSSLLPISMLFQLAKFSKGLPFRRFLLGKFGKSFFTISPWITLGWYIGEWFWMITGFSLVFLSIFILCVDSNIFYMVLLPQLVSLFGQSYAYGLISALGIEHLPASTPWWTYPFTTLYSGINWGLNFADSVVNYAIAWNTFVFKTLKSAFGLIGLWALIKTMSLIKLVYATTVAAMQLHQLTGPIAAVATFVSQGLIQVFCDPLWELYTNFTLSKFVLFLVPDPTGVWNLFISFNIIPWRILQVILQGFETSAVLTTALGFLISGWNLILHDLPWDFMQVLSISTPPSDIITYILGPLDSRLGSIVRSISTLYTIWR